MSLVVTSNIATEDDPSFSNVFKPFSYQNRLLNTMRIPPMSEIALQSAKINKNGLFVLDRANSGFCHYFGTPLENLDAEKGFANSTSQPFRAVIGSGEAFRAGDKKNEVNIDDMAVEINKGLNEAVFHPSMITGDSTTTMTVTPLYDGTNLNFNGFKFVATQQTAKTTVTTSALEWTDISKNDSYNFSATDGTVESTNINGFYVQNLDHPISQNAGECIFNFSDANLGGRWMVGLSRFNKQRDIGGDGDYDYLPTYWDDSIIPTTNSTVASGVWTRNQVLYADVCVMRVGTELRVYQSGARTAAGIFDGIYMNQVTYYGLHNANFGAIYNIGTNSGKYRKVKFVLNNEELQIYLIDDKAAEVLLCDFSTLRAAGAVKNECLNPINAAKWAMYPVCAGSGRSAAGGQKIVLESVQHYTNYPSFDVDKYFRYDWWGWSQKYNQTVFCKMLEMRDWNNFSRTVSQHGVGANGLLAPKGVNASGGMVDYESIIITARSQAYGSSTDKCNTQFTLGFGGDPISNPVTTALVSTNESTTTPKLVSNISLFIRLNNFTQNSVNARQGTTSKIIAHLPRFDNSGNETGGLYFEPHEKTYLALNNPQELLINSFDVDIVYDNETLCTALTGKTIVCFHIRQIR
jgi:hypothetical protein